MRAEEEVAAPIGSDAVAASLAPARVPERVDPAPVVEVEVTGPAPIDPSGATGRSESASWVAEEPLPATVAAEADPLEALTPPPIPEWGPDRVAPPPLEPRSDLSAPPADEPALADLAAAELAKGPSFELDAPGCDTEPYMVEMRPTKGRVPEPEEARRPLDGDSERRIEWLNACQRTVYRVVRAEVGAGAANFVRFCGEKLPDGFGAVFSHVELQEDGSWDVVGLRAALRRKGPGDLHAGFGRLIEKELEMVQVHLGPERADALRRKIEELENAATT